MAVLTISREYGSDGREIGQQIAQNLQYAYVDKDRLFLDLEQIGARWGQVARDLDEVTPTLWERYDWQYRGYIALVEAVLYQYAAADKVVIVGRGGFYLLRQVPFCLKIRLVAPLETRLHRIMKQENLAYAAAKKRLQREDQDRAGYILANYNTDWDDQSFYDLVLNTGDLTDEQAVDILMAALREKEALATPEAREHLADLALAAHIKAQVATDPTISVPTLTVSPEGGAIVVSGVIHSPREMQRVQKIVMGIVGSRAVRFDLRHRG
jgi:cytidylate kinase